MKGKLKSQNTLKVTNMEETMMKDDLSLINFVNTSKGRLHSHIL